MTNSTKVKSDSDTLSAELIAFLDKADSQIAKERKNKNQRAVDTLALTSSVFANFKLTGKVTLLGVLIQRSEFSGLVRMIAGCLISNISISGSGSNKSAPTITFEGNKGKPMWVTPMLDTLKAFVDETDDNGKPYRIDSADVKDVFGIPMSHKEKIDKAYKIITGLTTRKVDGDLLTDLLTAEQVRVLDHLIEQIQPTDSLNKTDAKAV